jgi:hypothetical protein
MINFKEIYNNVWEYAMCSFDQWEKDMLAKSCENVWEDDIRYFDRERKLLNIYDI